MINWPAIRTVFLDMDGTLLDLRFDSYFWFHHLPLRFSEKYGISYDEAKEDLTARYRQMRGTLQWYCSDYWSEELGLDVTALKHEIRHRVTQRPHVVEFLVRVRETGRPCYLVTNAHPHVVTLKLRESELRPYFEKIISSHDFGMPKETPEFWQVLKGKVPYHPASTLMVDDNQDVLHHASQAGVGHLLTIRQPDSSQPARAHSMYPAIQDFSEIMPPNLGPMS